MIIGIIRSIMLIECRRLQLNWTLSPMKVRIAKNIFCDQKEINKILVTFAILKKHIYSSWRNSFGYNHLDCWLRAVNWTLSSMKVRISHDIVCDQEEIFSTKKGGCLLWHFEEIYKLKYIWALLRNKSSLDEMQPCVHCWLIEYRLIRHFL